MAKAEYEQRRFSAKRALAKKLYDALKKQRGVLVTRESVDAALSGRGCAPLCTSPCTLPCTSSSDKGY